MQNKKYDIIIAGAGITGLTQALLLSSLNLKIAIFDRKFPDSDKLDLNNYDLRVSAITPKSTEIFKSLDIWQDILNLRAQPYDKMHVWDSGIRSDIKSNIKSNINKNTKSGYINFTSKELGHEYLGHIIENKVITYCLYKKLKQKHNIDIITGSIIKLDNNKKNIDLDNNTSIFYDLLIAADGANSWIRNKLDIELSFKDYEQQACVCTVQTEDNLNKCAWQRFLPTGPLAFLPLNKNTASIVWTQDNKNAEQTKQLNNQDFEKQLTKQCDNKLGKIKLLSPRASFPLTRQHAKTYIQENIALIGDAAHRIHPLAGQGANIGILDAVALKDNIQKAINKSRKFYTLNWLKKYEQTRWLANQNMMLSMSGFNLLFSNNNYLNEKLRTDGLNLANKSRAFKNICSRTF